MTVQRDLAIHCSVTVAAVRAFVGALETSLPPVEEAEMRTAEHLLEASGVAARSVRSLLPEVDAAMTPVHALPRWARRLLPRGVAAVALPGRIIVRDAALGSRGRDLARLLVHELVHVEQWRRHGPVRFLARYVGSYLGGRWRGLSHDAAYRSIPLEREAESIARRVSGTPARRIAGPPASPRSPARSPVPARGRPACGTPGSRVR